MLKKYSTLFALAIFTLLIGTSACNKSLSKTKTASKDAPAKAAEMPPAKQTKPEDAPLSLQEAYHEKILPGVKRVAFYNVENLFDTVDDPGKNDESFTPDGYLSWTMERYRAKLVNVAKVISGMDFPELLGLCEVENENVLKDLTTHPDTKAAGYDFVHFESPDKRGIDCALLYQKSVFTVEDAERIQIDFPEKIVKDYTTRDILYVKGLYEKKHALHLLVVHWPSRRGGVEASEPKRIYVAEQVKKKVDALLKADPDANIIIMGDFNDTPTNNSVTKVLNAQSPERMNDEASLYNCSLPLAEKGLGSHNYRGDWAMLDQIVVSKSLLDDDGIKAGFTKLYQPKEIIFKHPKYGITPNRTYGGKNYYGGFSDHLPIYIELN